MEKLQYITQDIPGKAHWELAEEACQAGVRWVQLRVKDKPLNDWIEIAAKTKEVCSKWGAKLIINDSPEVCLAVEADGIHLGKNDVSVSHAKQLLKGKMIIGGTANTFEDIKLLTLQRVSYIGLGPFRFTSTKQNLSPILGVEGYHQILNKCKAAGIKIPIVAIGGIVPDNLPELMETGIHGIAVASVIAFAKDKTSIVNQFNELMTLTNAEDRR